MNIRFLLSGLLVFTLVTEVTAQNRIRWRPGAILDGIAGTVQEVARDVGVREVSIPLPEVSEDGGVDEQNHPAVLTPANASDREGNDLPAQRGATGITTRSSSESSRAVSVDDVIMMVHRGLGESTIVQFIGDNGVKQRLDVSDLIHLHEEGVSEPIILAMQTSKVREATPPPIRMLPTTKGGHAQSNSRVLAPPRRSLEVDRFGPSILVRQADDSTNVEGSRSSNATVE